MLDQQDQQQYQPEVVSQTGLTGVEHHIVPNILTAERSQHGKQEIENPEKLYKKENKSIREHLGVLMMWLCRTHSGKEMLKNLAKFFPSSSPMALICEIFCEETIFLCQRQWQGPDTPSCSSIFKLES